VVIVFGSINNLLKVRERRVKSQSNTCPWQKVQSVMGEFLVIQLGIHIWALQSYDVFGRGGNHVSTVQAIDLRSESADRIKNSLQNRPDFSH
jgi:hypothetical protein